MGPPMLITTEGLLSSFTLSAHYWATTVWAGADHILGNRFAASAGIAAKRTSPTCRVSGGGYDVLAAWTFAWSRFEVPVRFSESRLEVTGIRDNIGEMLCLFWRSSHDRARVKYG